MKTMLEWALHYHRMGLTIIPLNKGLKTPIQNNWQAESNQTEDRVRELFTHHDGNIGCVCGSTTGTLAVDVDVKLEKVGAASIAVWEAAHGELPETLTTISPSGGWHHIYKISKDTPLATSRSAMGKDIDVQVEKSQVVLPPSELIGNADKNGRPQVPGCYKAIEAPIANCPESILKALVKPKSIDSARVFTAWTPLAHNTQKYFERVALQKKLFLEYRLLLTGGGNHQYIFMFQALGPGLGLDEETTFESYKEVYDPRLGDDCWLPDFTDELLHCLSRAYDGDMTQGAKPYDTWKAEKAIERISSPKKEIPNADEICKIITRRTKGLNHQYTFEVGEASNGKAYKATMSEVVSHLIYASEEWAGVLQYDEFGDKIVAVDPPLKLDAEKTMISNSDIDAMRCWFEVKTDLLINKEMMLSAIVLAAKRLTFHPVKDYLESLPPVEEGYLDEFANYVFGSIEPIQVEFVKMMLVGAVQRIYEPGCFVKSMLILYGNQNAGKSSFCDKLFGRWFKDGVSDLKHKDAVQELLGMWGVEMSEMDSIARADILTTKSFVSRKTDIYRPSYQPCSVERPRQNIFIGTTNEDDFLRDPTGATRFMPLEVPDHMPTDWSRDEVWSAAMALYRSGYKCWLEDTEQHKQADTVRQANIYQDPWTVHVEKAIANKERVSAQQIAMILLPDLGQLDPRAMSRVQATLKRICGGSYRVGSKDRTRYYKVPERYQKTKEAIINA